MDRPGARHRRRSPSPRDSRYRHRRSRSQSRGNDRRRGGRRSPSPSSRSVDSYRDRRGIRRSRSRDINKRGRRSDSRRRRSPSSHSRYRDDYDDRHRRRDRSYSMDSRSRRRTHRRRRRSSSRPRSPSSPSTPRQPTARNTGVVSDDEINNNNDGASRVMVQNKEKSQQNKHASSSVARDDSKGHFQGGEGTEIGGRYRVLRDVGLGTFGRVVECVDLKRARRANGRGGRDGPRVAIKVVRGIKRYYDSALIEADIVEDVNRRGGRGTALCAVLLDSFTWKSHYCLVFESLGPSLFDFMKRHNYQPFPMVCVRDFTMQLLEALEFLHSFGLIHTDLKPENILLCSSGVVDYHFKGRRFRVPESTRIKLIDFGGAHYNSDRKKSSVINTRQYRAPEVILGLEWSMPSDVWSLGCILAELYLGGLLFATHDNVEHLALIEKCIGPFPKRMLDRSTLPLVSEAFDSSGRHRLDRVLSSENAAYVKKSQHLDVKFRGANPRFLQMLRRMLVIDPDARTPAHECVRYRL